MSIKLPGVHSSDLIVFPMRGRPLGQADQRFVQSAIADIARRWSVELQGTCSDDVTLIVVPDSGEDAIGPSFAICREAFGFRLCQVHWDELTEVGVFTSLNDVAATLRAHLLPCSSAATPASATLH